MPCLSGEYNPQVGILLQVAVLPGGSVEKARSAKPGQNTVELKNRVPVSGLMDTGATMTCLASDVAQAMQLRPVGKISVSSATGVAEMNQYIVDLLLQFGQRRIYISNHTVSEFTATTAKHYQMLIGRDIICGGVLTMDLGGRFSFSV